MFSDKRSVMNDILYKMFLAYETREKYYSATDFKYTKSLRECFIEVAGDDVIFAETLYLMASEGVFNDLQEIAPHYGVGFREITNPGHVVNDIPPAPSPEAYWDYEYEEWKMPEDDKNKSEKVIVPDWPLI